MNPAEGIHKFASKANRSALLSILIVLTAMVWIFVAQTMRPVAATQTSPRPNFQAPDFSLPTLDGRQVALRELRGREVLINFWATWCVPCRAEMPFIQAAHEAARGRGLVVLAINEGEDNETVARFVQEFKLTFPVLLDRDETVGKDYDAKGLPVSFFIDRDGVIRAVRFGEMNRAYIESQLSALGIPALSDWEESSPAVQFGGNSPDKLNMDLLIPPGVGHDVFVQTCLACHDALTFGLARKTKDAWMNNRANHAKRFSSLRDEEVERLYSYLVENFNPDVPISNQVPQTYLCGT